MIRLGILFQKYIPFALLLISIAGCKRFTPEGEELIFGTATINGKSYKDSQRWYWNYQPEPPGMAIRTKYMSFDFRTQLKPVDAGLPGYSINFYVSIDGDDVKMGYPYKLGHYKKLEVDDFNYWTVMPYYFRNRAQIVPDRKEGIAFALAENSQTPISLEGILVVEKIGSRSNIRTGYYTLTTPEDASIKMDIKGRFEATHYNSIETFKER